MCAVVAMVSRLFQGLYAAVWHEKRGSFAHREKTDEEVIVRIDGKVADTSKCTFTYGAQAGSRAKCSGFRDESGILAYTSCRIRLGYVERQHNWGQYTEGGLLRTL
ncbi:hypothetical protein BKA67DRAFT_543367 [Truncatella angustata]|uniref:Secreted protein n=1 Tax=Truncatella angustata TaxID=152316 RepID=A0A9P9A2E4_9PEZI|nr:uncharacterized protein BKA67DRAFT_543367 [Truncatella angustata]KAH6659043.1 hypothetical protein BKA67DRAFT_543367 [Truncatella angustata]